MDGLWALGSNPDHGLTSKRPLESGQAKAPGHRTKGGTIPTERLSLPSWLWTIL